MFQSKEFQIEYKINTLRLELLKLITEINRLLSAGAAAMRSKEYRKIKDLYNKKKGELKTLRNIKENLADKSMA